MKHSKSPRTVEPNCAVTISGFEPDGKPETYAIVDDGQADVLENRLGVSSPLAQVLLGTPVGESVTFHPPVGKVELTVEDVSPLHG